MCFFVDPSPVRRVPIPTGIQRKLNFVSVRTIKGSSSYITSLKAAVSRLSRFSGPRAFLLQTCVTLSLFKLCTRPLRLTCLQRLSLTLILTRSLRTMTEFFLSICFLWEAYRDCFYDSSFSLRFFLEFSHVESFTTSLRYQALLSFL